MKENKFFPLLIYKLDILGINFFEKRTLLGLTLNTTDKIKVCTSYSPHANYQILPV
jgi:hypothetical protein